MHLSFSLDDTESVGVTVGIISQLYSEFEIWPVEARRPCSNPVGDKDSPSVSCDMSRGRMGGKSSPHGPQL